MDAAILTRFSRDRAAEVIHVQVRRIAKYSLDWLLSPELHRLAMLFREAANDLDQAANERNGVGRRA